jgi:hypothetical protein
MMLVHNLEQLQEMGMIPGVGPIAKMVAKPYLHLRVVL